MPASRALPIQKPPVEEQQPDRSRAYGGYHLVDQLIAAGHLVLLDGHHPIGHHHQALALGHQVGEGHQFEALVDDLPPVELSLRIHRLLDAGHLASALIGTIHLDLRGVHDRGAPALDEASREPAGSAPRTGLVKLCHRGLLEAVAQAVHMTRDMLPTMVRRIETLPDLPGGATPQAQDPDIPKQPRLHRVEALIAHHRAPQERPVDEPAGNAALTGQLRVYPVEFLQHAQPIRQGHQVVQAAPARQASVVILTPLQGFAYLLLVPVQDLPTHRPHPLSGTGVPQAHPAVYPLRREEIDSKPQ
jgi:hypothetical protein